MKHKFYLPEKFTQRELLGIAWVLLFRASAPVGHD